MSALLAIVVLALFVLGYRFYAKWIGTAIYDDQASLVTPAHTFQDGQDFVPTNKHVLFGHHFTSIAGAAPIIGPCVAAYWGWLPALVWVVVGTIFMGAVHDFGALMMSAREQGRSIADISASVISPRVRIMFLCFVAMLVWLVLAVFSMAIAGLFVSQPTSVLPINIEIIVAAVVGTLIHKYKKNPLWPSLVALVVLYGFVWLGTIVPISLSSNLAFARNLWIVLLLLYSAAASVLPVWFLLQPRDFINSHQLMVGLALLFAGLFWAHPTLDAPMLRVSSPDAPSMFPLLFVTVACGAISGFHGLVSSGTTSKQLNKLSDARMIGYGSMLGEGSLALASMMAAVAGIGLVTACHLPAQGGVPDLSWNVYYDSWAHAGANKASAFVLGGGAFLESLGLPTQLSRTVMAVLVISFAATTLDTATRIQRFILAELGVAIRVKPLENVWVSTGLAVVPALVLALWQVKDPTSGSLRQVGWVLWPIFGASNQMLAALNLLVIALYFAAKKRPVWPLVLPMLFVMMVALLAIGQKLASFVEHRNWLLAFLSLLLLLLNLWMMVEGAIRVVQSRKQSALS
jgi:carbon starvation protein